jgi:uridine phosphorylase
MAADALLPGDPARALSLAQELISEPLMSNHARGLWGYTGKTPAGDELTIQSTGIGAASGAVVLAELAGLGVESAIRIGTCRALNRADATSEPGDVLVAQRVLALDGISAGLSDEGFGEVLEPDPLLTGLLIDSGAGRPGTIAGTDPLTSSRSRTSEELEGADAADLQVSALVAVGRKVGVAVGCIDLVVESADGSSSLDDDEVIAASIRIGEAARKALGEKS